MSKWLKFVIGLVLICVSVGFLTSVNSRAFAANTAFPGNISEAKYKFKDSKTITMTAGGKTFTFVTGSLVFGKPAVYTLRNNPSEFSGGTSNKITVASNEFGINPATGKAAFMIFTYPIDPETRLPDVTKPPIPTPYGTESSPRSVKITNNLGGTVSPSISISAPNNNVKVSGKITVSAKVSNVSDLVKVQFLVDDFHKYNDASAPYSIKWDTTEFGNTKHTLKAVALDKDGNTIIASKTITVTVDNGGEENSACLKEGGTGMEWAICPMLEKTGDGTNKIDGLITSQLHYDVSDNLPNDRGAYKAWAAIKNLVSALIVIVMLVMVISQAIGGGPFEAYTIKKMLPRLVVAVILIQISWFACKWAIGIANDLGTGIQQILLAPFGGGSNMGLFDILRHMGGGWAEGIGAATIIAGGVGAVVLGAIFLPGAMVMFFGMFLAVLMAFVMLLFRNVLIFALTLFSPLAFLFWSLPGQSTQRYWKFWVDNFTKLLMLFPLMISIIYAGRIFAWIIADSNRIPQGQAPGPIDLILIIVAYFGPYFIVFKAYKWGGSIMSAGGAAISNGINKAAKPATEYLDWRKGISRWKMARQTRRGELERRAKLGFAEGLQQEGRGGDFQRTRLLGVGRPRNEREVVRRARQAAEAEVEKNRRDEIQRATVQLMQNDLPQYHQGDHDDIREAIIRGQTINVRRPDGTATTFDGAAYAQTHPFGLRAALDRGVIHGHERAIEQYLSDAMASGDAQRMADATDFLNTNAATVGSEMPHLLKGMRIASSSRPEGIIKMRQEEIESILGTLSTRARAGNADAAEQLSIFLRNYAATATDERLRTQLDQGGASAVKAFVTSNTAALTTINTDPDVGRARYGLDQIEDIHTIVPTMTAAITPEAVAETNTALAQLANSISDQGTMI